jgi:hypothetical protein
MMCVVRDRAKMRNTKCPALIKLHEEKVFGNVSHFGINAVVMFILILLTHEAEPFLRSRQLCSHSRTSQHFIEPEGSISCSQEPSTGPYPEPY